MALATTAEGVATLPSNAELYRVRRQLNALASEVATHNAQKKILDLHDRRLYARAKAIMFDEWE